MFCAVLGPFSYFNPTIKNIYSADVQRVGGGGHSGQTSGLIGPKCKLPQHGSSFAGIMHSFAGMVHNEDTTWNMDQIPHSLAVMIIFLDLILRDFRFHIIS
jgi:hypothetical protein